MLIFIIILVLVFLYIVGVRETNKEKAAQAKQPQRNKQTPKTATAAKKFTPPNQFEYNLHLVLRLLASECNGDCGCFIEASEDTVRLDVRGIGNLRSLSEKYAPGVYKYLFCHPTYSDGHLRLTFHEPGCYIFSCPKSGMQADLDEHAPNASIDYWNVNGNKKQISIRFSKYAAEEEPARWKQFEKYYQIWCK